MNRTETKLKPMRIVKIIESVETGTAGNNPNWRVTFQTESGKCFRLESWVSWTKPDAQQIQRAAELHPNYFWQFWAKPVVVA